MIPVQLKRKKPSKYRSRKVVLDGIVFDSQAEAKRYGHLSVMQRSGMISDLAVHPEFRIEMNGALICRVILDFSYRDNKTGKTIWEDVKGKQTALSALKKKLVEAAHEIKVEIIR